MAKENDEKKEKEVKKESKPKEVKKERKAKDDHTIFVGGAEFMNYVTACVVQFGKNAKEIEICARGRYISRAVDVAEVVNKRFMKDQVTLGDITTDSEQFQNKDGRDVRVSTIKIILKKK